ncbi:MAG: outer membrane lipoprotein-sorting protein [Candidatus Omnitrophica bacterium]|nr:outer membrane lipoprotein-sorting protein [Candidatus Omnitrophota bacterium]
MRKLFLFFGILFFVFGGFAQDLEYHKVYKLKDGMSAEEIMRIKYHNKYSLFAYDYYSTSTIFYVDKSGFTRKKDAVRERIIKAGEDGISYKDLVIVTYPTESKGLAILSWTYADPKKEQDTWLWLPSLKKVRKISASEDDDAFMGADVTVQEVSTRGFQDETYELIGEEDFKGYLFEHTQELKFKGRPCFIIECRSTKPHWYYSKRIIWVDKDTGGNIFEEYYDKNDKLFKTLYRQWVWFDIGGGKLYPIQEALECKDLRTGHRTVVLIENSKYDQGISEQDFTVKSLMRSRW